jgi:predicted DNA-binding protein with PD1-like motif
MEYTIGHVGRVVVARFQDHDDILAGLTDIARRENIRAAVIHLVGGVRQGAVVVGPQDDAQMPP